MSDILATDGDPTPEPFLGEQCGLCLTVWDEQRKQLTERLTALEQRFAAETLHCDRCDQPVHFQAGTRYDGVKNETHAWLTCGCGPRSLHLPPWFRYTGGRT